MEKKGSCRCGCGRVLLQCCSSCCSFLVLAVGSGTFLVQMMVLNYILSKRVSRWVWLSLLVEVPVALHMAAHCQTQSAVQSGSLQWIVYCWLLSAKIGVLYFQVMPKLNYEEVRTVVTILVLTPVLYLVLTMRTLRQLFDQSSETWERGTSSKRERREHVTLDVVLLQDMVWHVVIDMIDVLQIMFLARPGDPQDGVGETLVKEFPVTVAHLSRAAGAFACVGFLFHQQSFPHTSYVAARTAPRKGDIPRTGADSSVVDGAELCRTNSEDTLISSERTISPVRTMANTFSDLSRVMSPRTIGRYDDGHGLTEGVRDRWGAATSLHGGQEYGIDVVKARKRSAIVSILLIDLPFFVLRTYLYSLSLSLDSPDRQFDVSPVIASQATSAVGSNSTLARDFEKKPEVDKWLVKNGLCLLLQAMQLRFVQQADVEQSQKLQWRDTHQFQVTAYKRIGRRRRIRQDPNLKQAWQDMDWGPPVPSVASTVGSSAEESVSDEFVDAMANDSADEHTVVHTAASPVVPPVSSSSADTLELGGQSAPSRRKELMARLWSCCPRRTRSNPPEQRVARRRRLLSCCCRSWRCRSCPHAIVLHSLMGLVAGWLLAKQDFAQAHASLLLAMGKDASTVEGSTER